MKTINYEYVFVNNDIQIQWNGKFDRNEMYDTLGDLVLANEINPNSGTDYIALDNELYELHYSDIKDMYVKAYHIGPITDNIDMGVKSDKGFIDWYFRYNNAE